jgi:PhnB protein
MSKQFDPYLFFPGNCAEAMRFYEKALGGKIQMMMTHGDMPIPPGAPPIPAGSADLVMHCSLVVEGRVLMASDWLASEAYPGIHGVAISLSYPDVAKAQAVFSALAEGGKVGMPMQKTFWVESFGMTVDRFGTPWMINGGQPAQMPG